MQVERVKRRVGRVIAALEKELGEIDAEITLPSAARRSGEGRVVSVPGLVSITVPASSLPNCRNSALPSGPRIIFRDSNEKFVSYIRGLTGRIAK